MAEEGGPSGEGDLCPISRLLQSPEAASQKEAVLRIVRAARSQPTTVMPALVGMLQRDKAPPWQKVAVYRSLRAMLEHGLPVEPACDFIVAASKQLRASPEPDVPRELQAAASNTLATFARHHFNPIMTELQRQLRPFAEPDEFTLLTLGKIAAGNVYSCVPFLGITLTTLQSAMRWIEDGQRRKALCTALEQMCRAIRTYLRTWERSSYPRISVQQFSTYLLPLYTCITRTWLPGSDSQVKLAVLKTLGPMLNILLPRTEFQGQIYGDIRLLLAQYESSVDAFQVTKILGQILEASLVNSNPIPQMHVEPLARTLTRQICSSGQKGQPPRQEHSEENRAEISQIFLRLARSHPSELLWVFQGKLEDVREEQRVVLLALLAEIVAAQLPELWSRRQLCVKALKAVLGDERTRVRLATLRTMGNLLRTGYMEKVEGWPLNYILLQLSVSAHQLTHPTLRLRLGGLEEKAVERASAEALQVAVAFGRGASQELWLRMLGYVTQPHYVASAAPLCRALRQLAEQRLRQAVHGQDSRESVNLPTPQELMARLLTLAVSPLEGSGRGAAALLLLNALRPEIYKEVAEHWWVEVPVMVHYLEGHSRYTLEPAVWELKLLEFLKKSLQRNREADGWSLALAREFGKQMGTYCSSSAENAFLYKALGLALSAAGDAQGVTLQLLDLLTHTDYTDDGQRKGACWCLAHCAEGQLAAALQALRRFEDELSEGEDSVSLQFSQGLPPPEKGCVKSALLLLYSSATIRAPREQLLPHLAADIVPKILHHYVTSCSPERLDHPNSGPRKKGAQEAGLVLSFAQSVSEISLSAQGKGAAAAFPLPQKKVLLKHLTNIVKAEPVDIIESPIREQAMAALRHLSKVPEALSREENREVAEVCLSRVLVLPPAGLTEDVGQALHTAALASLAELVEALLEEEEEEEKEAAAGEAAAAAGPRSEWFQHVFQLLGYWMVSEREWERSRAIQLGAHLLRACHHRRTGSSPRIPSGQFSRLVGVLAPFTCDTLGTIRQGAGDCIRVLLSLQGAVVPPREPKGRVEEWRLRGIRQDLRSDHAREVHVASLQLAKVVSAALPSPEIVGFLRALLEQLRAVSGACDQAVLLWFEVAVRERGADLKDKVRDMVAVICSSLRHSEDLAQRRCLAQAVCILAERRRKAVCTSLLEHPLLHDRARKELWAALATSKSHGAPVLKYLLSRVRAEGSGAPSSVPALVALQEVVSALESCTTLVPLLSELCQVLLWKLSRYPDEETPTLDVSAPESKGDLGTPRRLAVGVLQTVLTRATPEAARDLDAGNAWTAFMQPGSSLRGVALLARALVRSENPLLDELLHRLVPSLSSSRAACKDLGLVFCMEHTGHPWLQQKPETLDLLLRQLLAGSRNGNATMRFLSVRGLRNVAEGAPREAKKHQKALLDALLLAVGDAASPEVAREGLLALSAVWGCLERRQAACASQAVAGQARSYFWHADEALRAAAFQLFGQLAGATQPKCAKPFAKEAGRALAALLLHFRDPSPGVAKACCGAFVACAPSLGLQELATDMDAGLVLADVSGARHSRVMDRACQRLAQTDPPLLDAILVEVPQYLRCAWEGIRLAACKLAGILVEAVDTQRLGRLDLGQLLQTLHSLGQDPSATVEIASSEAAQALRRKQEESQARPDGGQLRRAALADWFFRRRRRKGGLAALGPS